MTRLRWLIVLIVLVAVVGAVLAVARPQTFYPFYPQGKERVLVVDEPSLAANITYPEFGRAVIDMEIGEWIGQGLVNDLKVGEAGHQIAANERATLTVTYEVPFRTVRYASVVFHVTVSNPAEESSHSDIRYEVARTYDLLKDRTVTYASLGEPGRDPYQAGVLAIRLHLADNPDVDQARLEKNLVPKEATFREMILVNDGLIVYLAPGQVAPNEKGSIPVHLLRGEIGDIRQP